MDKLNLLSILTILLLVLPPVLSIGVATDEKQAPLIAPSKSSIFGIFSAFFNPQCSSTSYAATTFPSTENTMYIGNSCNVGDEVVLYSCLDSSCNPNNLQTFGSGIKSDSSNPNSNVVFSGLGTGNNYLYYCYSCSSGSSSSCTDTDGGYNTESKGTVTAIDDIGTETITDYCTSSINLNEFLCESNGLYSGIAINCGADGGTCSDGKCIGGTTSGGEEEPSDVPDEEED